MTEKKQETESIPEPTGQAAPPTPIDPNAMSLDQLKVMAYDTMGQIAAYQNGLRELQAIIAQREAKK